MTVGSIIGEPLEIHKIAKGSEKEERVACSFRKWACVLKICANILKSLAAGSGNVSVLRGTCAQSETHRL
jgi:hypothetical protein